MTSNDLKTTSNDSNKKTKTKKKFKSWICTRGEY